jgi:hypothetical protein
MTPRQRRAQQTALERAAAAPRKSWLGKFTPLTRIQSAWIKSLLTAWGEGVRGGTAPRLPKGHACWRMLKGARWSDKALEKFTAAITQARKEGLRGEDALKRAHTILWPREPRSVIDAALQKDDVDFVEQCVLLAFDQADPVYIVGVTYYTTRKKISDITRDLKMIAPWLTDRAARERVGWCLKIFRAKIFLIVRNEMKSD